MGFQLGVFAFKCTPKPKEADATEERRPHGEQPARAFPRGVVAHRTRVPGPASGTQLASSPGPAGYILGRGDKEMRVLLGTSQRRKEGAASGRPRVWRRLSREGEQAGGAAEGMAAAGGISVAAVQREHRGVGGSAGASRET